MPVGRFDLADGYWERFQGTPDTYSTPKSSGQHLHCPVCDYDYVHFDKPQFTPNDDYKAWTGRGSAIHIPMSCEHGHTWTLRIGFHKGFTFMDILSGEEEAKYLGKVALERFEAKHQAEPDTQPPDSP